MGDVYTNGDLYASISSVATDVKRFGHMPSFEYPIGWDKKNFRETFKTKDLPFLTTEEYNWEDGVDVKVSNDQNRLIWGDNLAVMRSMPDECIDLIYIDPPFFSGRNYNCIFGDDDEVRSFSDIWDGGLPTYLAWLNARLWEMKRLLKPTGSIFVHLDWHASHYVKCELDKIFGYDNFRNEICWRRGKGASRTDGSQFQRNHDVIIWFSKTNRCKYQRAFKPYNDNTLAMYRYNDNDGRGQYRLQELRTYSSDTIKKMEKEGRIYTAKNGKKSLKQYLKDKTGVAIDSIWEDIGGMAHGGGNEKIGYPTQKPEKLIERILTSCSNLGETIADFFTGGGTTCSVAEKLGRRWIGCDISRIAISICRDRVAAIYDEKNKAGIAAVNKKPKYSFVVQNHGAYDRNQVKNLEAKDGGTLAFL
jgi:DNA modification methylase